MPTGFDAHAAAPARSGAGAMSGEDAGRDVVLISYAEAGRLLGKGEQAMRSIVHRSQFSTYPDPHDKRRRLLSRSEVERYAVRTLLAAQPAPVAPAPTLPTLPGFSIGPDLSPQLLGAVAGGIALVGVLLLLFRYADDAKTRALIVGAIAGVALFVAAEWQEEGRISAQERARIEELARRAEADPEPFVSEVEQVLAASA